MPFAAAALLMIVFPAGAAGGQQPVRYSWSLSESSTSPWVNVGSPLVGEREIYLWTHCDFNDGWIEVDLDVVGSLELVSFTPVGGAVSSGTLPNVHLTAPSCSDPYSLAGLLVVRDPAGTGGSLCFGGANTTRDCGGLGGVMNPNVYLGYSTDGTVPCQSADICYSDIAVPETWGRVKACFPR